MGALVRYLTNKHPDLPLIEKALKGNWNVSDTQKRKLLKKLIELCDSPNQAVAVKAMRVMQMALADDQRHMLQTLALLQQDQLADGPTFQYTADWFQPEDETDQKLLEGSTDDVHEYLKQRAQREHDVDGNQEEED